MIERISKISKKFSDIKLLDLKIPLNINMNVNNTKQVFELVVIKAQAIKN